MDENTNQNNTVSESTSIKQVIADMPVGLKLLALLDVFGVFSSFSKIAQNSPVALNFFNTGFPANSPVFLHLYYLFHSGLFLFAVFKRSRQAWKIYLIISVLAFVTTLVNNLFFFQVPQQLDQNTSRAIIFISEIIGGLILFYIYRKKEYFTKK